jgi:hypothetical protein
VAQTGRHLRHPGVDHTLGRSDRVAFRGGGALAGAVSSDFLFGRGNRLDLSTETTASVDGNGTFQDLKQTVRGRFIDFGVLDDQITAFR